MYWPTMPDNILDTVIDATAGTRDTWWSKFLLTISIIIIAILNLISNCIFFLFQSAQMDMITLFKMYAYLNIIFYI